MRYVFGAMAIPLPQVNQLQQAGERVRERASGEIAEAAQFNADSHHTPSTAKPWSSSQLQ